MRKTWESHLLLSALYSLANAILNLMNKRNTKTKENSLAIQAHFLNTSSAGLGAFLIAFPNTNATVNKKANTSFFTSENPYGLEHFVSVRPLCP